MTQKFKNSYFNRNIQKFKKKKICVIRGNFNVIHSGHLRIFQMAKKLSSILIIFLNKNNSNIFIDINNRLEVLKSIKLIDFVYVEDCNYLTFLNRIKPKIIIKGIEYKKEINIEEKILNKYKGKIVFSPGQKQIKKKYIEKEINKNLLIGYEQKKYIKTFCIRNKISINNLIKKFKKISSKITVMGDIILDQYIDCELMGTSKEEPSMVIVPNGETDYVGGSGIVAKHISYAGCQTNLISIIGKDKHGKKIKNDLLKNNVYTNFLEKNSSPTIVKKRYQIDDRSIIKINNVKRYDEDNMYEKKLFNFFMKNSKKIDHLVFSDFSYGVLTESLVRKITDFCKKNKISFSADAQSSSQVGNILKYKNAELLTPTEYEARLSLSDNISGVANLSNKLMSQTNCKNLILKLGSEGILIFSRKKNKILNDAIPALNTKPFDTSGAGDSLLSYAVVSLANKLNIWEASLIGSIAATLQISRQGNKPIKSNEILEILSDII